MVGPKSRAWLIPVLLLLVFAADLTGHAAAPRAVNYVELTSEPVQQMTLSVGQSCIVCLDSGRDVHVGNPTCLDIMPMKGYPGNYIVWAKAPGFSAVGFLGDSGGRPYRTLLVSCLEDKSTPRVDPDEIRKALGYDSIEPLWVGDSLVLRGSVPSYSNRTAVGELAAMMAPKVVNALTLSDPVQVQLECTIAEVSKDVGLELGFNYKVSPGINGGPGRSTVNATFQSGELNVVNFLWGVSDVLASVKAKDSNAKVDVLYRQTLVAREGEEAYINVGGEVPTVTKLETAGGVSTQVTYHKYGVQLAFNASVDQKGNVALTVKPEISSIDWANAVQGQPAFRIRTTSTKVDVKDGGTIALGGLLSRDDEQASKAIPFIGRIPIIGRLFGSSDFRKGKTELVVFVTPRVVRGFSGIDPKRVGFE